MLVLDPEQVEVVGARLAVPASGRGRVGEGDSAGPVARKLADQRLGGGGLDAPAGRRSAPATAGPRRCRPLSGSARAAVTRTRSPSAWRVPVTTWSAPSASRLPAAFRPACGRVVASASTKIQEFVARSAITSSVTPRASRSQRPGSTGSRTAAPPPPARRRGGGRSRARRQRPEDRTAIARTARAPIAGTATRRARHGFALRRQPIAPAAHGLDCVAGGAERPPDVADALHEAVVGDGDVAPYRGVQFVLRHGLAAPRRQRPQHRGGLGRSSVSVPSGARTLPPRGRSLHPRGRSVCRS